MQAITVAIADDDEIRRARYEHFLQGAPGIRVLTDVTARTGDISKIRELNPRVLLVSLKQCSDADYAMLNSLRRECPEMGVILLTDEASPHDDLIIQALAKGARGYLNLEAGSAHISKAVRVIERGEAWVPRKMLKKVMDQILIGYHQDKATSN